MPHAKININNNEKKVRQLAEISNNDLFLAINKLAKSVNEIKVVVDKTEERVGNLEDEIREVKNDVKKVDKKVGRLAAELLDAKADISILQQQVN